MSADLCPDCKRPTSPETCCCDTPEAPHCEGGVECLTLALARARQERDAALADAAGLRSALGAVLALDADDLRMGVSVGFNDELPTISAAHAALSSTHPPGVWVVLPEPRAEPSGMGYPCWADALGNKVAYDRERVFVECERSDSAARRSLAALILAATAAMLAADEKAGGSK